MKIPFAKVSPLAKLPTRGTPGSAGLDLFAAVGYGVEVTLRPFERSLIPTGLQIQLPVGFEAQVRPRSGLALRHGITVLNSPGTIDSDYVVNDKGQPCEIMVLLGYDGPNSRKIQPGDRIAQIVFASTNAAEFDEKTAEQWPSAAGRRAGGFGSTGSS